MKNNFYSLKRQLKTVWSSFKLFPEFQQKKLGKKLLEFNFKPFLRNNLVYFLILAFLVGLTYVKSLSNGFVSDDVLTVQAIKEPGFLFSQLSQLAKEPFGVFRILVMQASYWLCNFEPGCVRLVNIFFHLGNVYLVFLLITLFVNRPVAFLTAALFAVHPLLSEAVVWISGAGYLQYAFFLMLALLFYMLSVKNKNYHYFALVSFGVAFFTIHQLFLVPIFFLYEYLFGPGVGGLKRNFKKLLPFLLLGLLWIFWQLFQISPRIDSLTTSGLNTGTFHNPLTKIPFVIGTYLLLFFYPKDLTFAHAYFFTDLNSLIVQYIINIGLLSAFILTLLASFFKNKIIFFWLGFFLISLATSLTPLRVSSLLAERYVYLGSISIFLLMSLIIYYLWKLTRLRKIIMFALPLIFGLLIVRNWLRIPDWQSDVTISEAILKINPGDQRTRFTLAVLYNNQEKYALAIQEYLKYIEIDPQNLAANNNLAYSYLQLKKYDQAKIYYLKTVQIDPKNMLALQNLAEAEFELGEYDQTLETLDKQIKLTPKDSTLHLNKGKVYEKLNAKEKAREEYQKALVLNPDNQAAKNYLQKL